MSYTDSLTSYCCPSAAGNLFSMILSLSIREAQIKRRGSRHRSPVSPMWSNEMTPRKCRVGAACPRWAARVTLHDDGSAGAAIYQPSQPLSDTEIRSSALLWRALETQQLLDNVPLQRVGQCGRLGAARSARSTERSASASFTKTKTCSEVTEKTTRRFFVPLSFTDIVKSGLQGGGGSFCSI